jgi:hypothetical protein
MHTTCFDQHWSSSGVSTIDVETAVFQSLCSIFGVCPRLCANVSYGDGYVLLLSRVELLRMFAKTGLDLKGSDDGV